MDLFKLATFNANSLRARLPVVTRWVAENHPDVLCIQETKVQDKDFPAGAFSELGYNIVYKGEKAYNGVAVATRALIEASDVKVGFDDGGSSEEARLIQVRVGDLRILNTYVPQGHEVESPKFAYKLEWYERLRGYISRHFEPGEKVVWTGDLNIAPEDIDVYDPKGLAGHVCFHPEVKRRLNDIMSWGLVDAFRHFHKEPDNYTYFDYRAINAVKRKIGWRIDHMMVTPALLNEAVDCVIDLAPREWEKPSDHTFLILHLKPENLGV